MHELKDFAYGVKKWRVHNELLKNVAAKPQKIRAFAMYVSRCLWVVIIAQIAHGVVGFVFNAIAYKAGLSFCTFSGNAGEFIFRKKYFLLKS